MTGRGESMGRPMDVASAAKRIGRSPSHVRRLIEAGKLPAVNVGTGAHRPTWRLDSDVVDTFVSRNPHEYPDGARDFDPDTPEDHLRARLSRR